MTGKPSEKPWSWTDEDPGTCPECGEAWELVRPGKSQPVCDCQDKCPDCGLMRRHFSQGEVARRMSGFLCANCDCEDDLRPSLVQSGIIPINAPPPRRWGEDA